jgi:predicted unusual protein kinase regulating ubiquinone biosynthesis (AarF/ABC1/UbiB family)
MFRKRYRLIRRFFVRMFVSMWWWDILLPKIGFHGASERTRPERMRVFAAAFRERAVRMGGVLIKIGQFFSARLDVLPHEITSELAGLQDEVGAEKLEDIRQVIESEFGVPLERKFLEFVPAPVASASIGQVHYARLCETVRDGTPCPPVVVKVQRRYIQEIIDADLAAIRAVGRVAARFAFVRKHVNVSGLIEEFSRTLYEEMDYLHEGKNAEQFAGNFKDRPEVCIPDVIWTHTTRRVLTLQDVGAIKITDYTSIRSAGISRTAVADRLLETYLKQFFEDGFFHADPHPGNIFIQPAPTETDPRAWRLVFVDFGMTGTLEPDTFSSLREVLIAIGTQDAARLVRSFEKLDILLPGADLELIERANRRLFEKIWGKSTREIMRMSSREAGEFAEEFGDLLYEMPFQIPVNLILLGRCVSILSGISSGLDPDFNVWKLLAPYARKLVEEGGEGRVRLVLREAEEIGRVLAVLPKRVDSLITRIEQGRFEVRMPEIRHYVTKLEEGVRKLAGSIVFAAVSFAAVAFLFRGDVRLSIALGILDVCLLLWILFGR